MTHEYGDWKTFNSPSVCPVPAGVRGQTQTANETRLQAEKRPPFAISAWVWDLGPDHTGRIIAYRILKEPKPFEPDLSTVADIARDIISHTALARFATSEADRECHKAGLQLRLHHLAYTLGCDIVKRRWGNEYRSSQRIPGRPNPIGVSNMDPLKLYRLPPDCAPNGVPVLVAGGVAMKKTGGEWFSGMSDEPFTRELNWEPKWWSPIPQQND